MLQLFLHMLQFLVTNVMPANCNEIHVEAQRLQNMITPLWNNFPPSEYFATLLLCNRQI